MYYFLKYIPKNHLSFIIGKLASIRLPRPFSTWLISIFAKLVGIDCESAERPINSYKSINDFFVRELKAGLRPIGENLVSPIDGTLRSCGWIDNDKIEQIKGIDYNLNDLLQDNSWAKCFAGGYYFNLYLSPKDYHHVHSPIDGDLIESRYIPGKLWPVNDWSMKNIPGLFTVNERMITYIKLEQGYVAVIMVGATNVGKISVAYDNSLNPYGKGYPREESKMKRVYDPSIKIEKGSKLGTFYLGSTVVLLLDPIAAAHLIKNLKITSPCSIAPRKVKYGESLNA